MKPLLIISILCIVLPFGLLGQDRALTPSAGDTTGLDPKLNRQEQEQLRSAVAGTPAKVITADDPKLAGQPLAEQAPWKTGVITRREEAIPDGNANADPLAPAAIEGSGQQQPAPETGEVMDYRAIKGPGSQPVPDSVGPVTDYRVTGESKEQPAGIPDAD